MKIKINYYGKLKIISQKDQEIFECQDIFSILEMVVELSKKYGKDFQDIVLDTNNQLKPSLLVVVNSNTVDKTKPFALKDGDEIKLLIAIAGG